MGYTRSEVAWEDQEISLNGTLVGKVTGLVYKARQEQEAIYAAGNGIVDIQPGNRSYDGTMSCYKSLIDSMNRAAQAAGYDDLLGPVWQLTDSYRPTANDVRRTNKLINVKFTEYEYGMEQNAKSMAKGLPFVFQVLIPAIG